MVLRSGSSPTGMASERCTLGPGTGVGKHGSFVPDRALRFSKPSGRRTRGGSCTRLRPPGPRRPAATCTTPLPTRTVRL